MVPSSYTVHSPCTTYTGTELADCPFLHPSKQSYTASLTIPLMVLYQTSQQSPQPSTHGSKLSYSACLTNPLMVPFYN